MWTFWCLAQQCPYFLLQTGRYEWPPMWNCSLQIRMLMTEATSLHHDSSSTCDENSFPFVLNHRLLQQYNFRLVFSQTLDNYAVTPYFLLRVPWVLSTPFQPQAASGQLLISLDFEFSWISLNFLNFWFSWTFWNFLILPSTGPSLPYWIVESFSFYHCPLKHSTWHRIQNPNFPNPKFPKPVMGPPFWPDHQLIISVLSLCHCVPHVHPSLDTTALWSQKNLELWNSRLFHFFDFLKHWFLVIGL